MSRNLNEQLATSHRPPFLEVEVLGIRVGEKREPLKVRIAHPDVEDLISEMKGLPGERPAEPKPQQKDTAQEMEDKAAADDLARRLVAKFTAVQMPDGTFVSPAFSFATPPDPDLLNGHELESHELQSLALAVMYMGNFARGTGGAAPESFLGQ